MPQDEGIPIPSSIWNTVTMLPNEDTRYGLLELVWLGVRDTVAPSQIPSKYLTYTTVKLLYSGLIRLSLSGLLVCFTVVLLFQ